jgi:hypothetical protein
MSRLPIWQRLILGLALLLPACNLSTVDPTTTSFPTATIFVQQATATSRATNTPIPTATRIAPTSRPVSTPVYNLSQPLPAPVCSIVPTVEAANIRSGAGTNFPVIGTVLANNWVLVSRLTTSNWYQISAPGTVVNGGWIAGNIVTLQQPCVCTPDSCTQSGIVPPAVPTTAASSGLPRVGFVGLQPSGAGPCVITGGEADVPIFSAADGNPPAIATLIPHGGLVAFAFQSGRYEVNFSVASQQLVGWVNANRVTVAGDCAPLTVPPVCSVQAPIGTISNVYAEPRKDAAVMTTINEFMPLPFIKKNADGWFNVNVGGSGTGWVAPDAGVLVGAC